MKVIEIFQILTYELKMCFILIRGIVKEKFGADQEIQIQYEDQATSDFNLLFRIVHGMYAIR